MADWDRELLEGSPELIETTHSRRRASERADAGADEERAAKRVCVEPLFEADYYECAAPPSPVPYEEHEQTSSKPGEPETPWEALRRNRVTATKAAKALQRRYREVRATALEVISAEHRAAKKKTMQRPRVRKNCDMGHETEALLKRLLRELGAPIHDIGAVCHPDIHGLAASADGIALLDEWADAHAVLERIRLALPRVFRVEIKGHVRACNATAPEGHLIQMLVQMMCVPNEWIVAHREWPDEAAAEATAHQPPCVLYITTHAPCVAGAADPRGGDSYLMRARFILVWHDETAERVATAMLRRFMALTYTPEFDLAGDSGGYENARHLNTILYGEQRVPETLLRDADVQDHCICVPVDRMRQRHIGDLVWRTRLDEPPTFE